MGASGQSFSEETVRRIISLLSSTDMTIEEISERMACSRSSVLSINRRFHVRDYGGLRSHWRINSTEAFAGEKRSA
jgi:hypothetical protein